MALQKNINYKGVTIENSYCKIINIQGDKNRLYYEIATFTSKELSQKNDNIIESHNYNFIPSGEVRWDKQCYEDAKKQEYFKDAIDLLDC